MKIKKSVINKIKDKQKEKDRIFELYKNASTVITKDEMHRLKKVLKNEDKEQKLRDWATGLTMQINNINAKQYYEYYGKKIKEDALWTVKCIEIVVKYTLHFNQNCRFGNKRIKDFMEDYRVSFELLTKKEYKLEDYIEQLKKEKIEV